jgi:uncharacterized FAD-dependent dehydrogenase
MPTKIQLTVSPEIACKQDLLKNTLAKELNIAVNRINGFHIEKKSIDARSKNIKVNLTINAFCDNEFAEKIKHNFNYQNISGKSEIIIVGAGPAGLFAALRLIELGYKPIVIERGKDVSERKRDIATLSRNEGLNTDSNYCFGEGGAGTFSDGKLYTRSKKRGNLQRIFEIFHYHGAQDEILYEAHPHIGSDRLPEVIKNIRKTIIECGGEVLFDKKVTDFIIEENKIKGVKTADGDIFNSSAVILATGHSARDIYETLYNKEILLEAKGFAMGVRAEHPQALIDSIQYKKKERGEFLPPAAYSLVEQVASRGVYSFCMCPGGIIVPASTGEKEIVVNGMSNSKRQSPFANSGIVVEIRPEDLGEFQQYGALAGLKYQQYVENMSFVNGAGGVKAPAQRLADFANGRLVPGLPDCSYLPGTISSPLHFWLPEFISKRLQQGFKLFDKKMHGYLTNEAVVVGVESRSSSPIRIPRDKETFEHVQIKGLFPCGEGAGYAGGITSSALDGENCAEMAVLKNKY